jgi:predicted ABC-type ATPase
MPKLTVVIGANGAGKSTWCRRHRRRLPEHFYNADSIADGLGDWNSPTNQRAARQLVDTRIKGHLDNKEDFGFESTYSGHSRPAIIERAKALGYRTSAIFVGTRGPQINIDV